MIKPSKSFFLLVITVLSALLLTSCNSQPSKVDNLCSLTNEQFPEVRGFRIGMTLEQILQKYPTLCKSDETVSNSVLIIKTSYQDLPPVVVTDSEDKSYTSDTIQRCLSQTRILDPKEHPELNGIYKIKLTIKENRLTDLIVKYGKTEDMTFFNSFHQKVKETLGITEWSNWETSEKTNSKFDKFSLRTESKLHTLQCNKLQVSIVTETSSIVGFPSYTYTTYLQLSENTDVAKTENQKRDFEKQKQNQEQAERDKKLEEERKKREDFKP